MRCVCVMCVYDLFVRLCGICVYVFMMCIRCVCDMCVCDIYVFEMRHEL